MQRNLSYLLLIPLLSSAACNLEDESDSHSDTPPSATDVRVELEVVGPGKIVIVEPVLEECTDATPVCSFSFPVGTQVWIEADFSDFPTGGWAEDCIGRDLCKLTLDQDSLVVGMFGQSPDIDIPETIVDPFIVDPPGYERFEGDFALDQGE